MANVNKQDFQSRIKAFVEQKKRRLTDEQDASLFDSSLSSLLDDMERSGWDSGNALYFAVPRIANRDLRDECRRILIALKCNAAEDFYGRRDSTQPWLSYVGDGCALLQCSGPKGDSTAILTPKGDIRIPQGLLHIGGRPSFARCFTAYGKGRSANKCGLVRDDGSVVLPCIFDEIENKTAIEASYMGVPFSIYFVDTAAPTPSSYERYYSIPGNMFMWVSSHADSKNPQMKAYEKEVFDILDKYYANGLQ